MDFLTNIFITITFFLPGFIAKFIDDYLSQAKDAKSEIKVTVYALLWNVPSVFVAWAALSIVRKHLLTSGNFVHQLQPLPIMLVYFVSAAIIDYAAGHNILKLVRKILSARLSAARKNAKLPSIADGLP